MVTAHGADAVSFQALKSATHWWHDASAPHGTGASIAYVPSGRAWVAIGSPFVADERKADAVRGFTHAARAAGCRPIFFAIEDPRPFVGGRRLQIGLQSVLRPAAWASTLRQTPKLREQLRRARAKGVTVRLVPAAELADGTPLRREVARLRDEWLGSRAMEPMGFLVAVEPFHAPDEHLYFVAERRGVPIQFLSAVPIPARQGWLMEDMLRGRAAPNGTTELVIDALMRRLAGDPFWITPGLTPLAGAIPWWLRVVRIASVPLYDFSGLRRFRARLKPQRWQPIWIAWDRGPSVFVLGAVLRLFANRRILEFAWRSLVRHPNGPPWAVAVPLVPWTVLLVGLVASGRANLLGFSTVALTGWIVFDTLLAGLLFAVARRPRMRHLALAAMAAGVDAIVSVRHLALAGLGPNAISVGLRLVATAGPLIGTAALTWACWRAYLVRRRRA